MMDNAAVVEKRKISKLLEFFNILQVFYNRFYEEYVFKINHKRRG
jgi:hypothetical protein